MWDLNLPSSCLVLPCALLKATDPGVINFILTTLKLFIGWVETGGERRIVDCCVETQLKQGWGLDQESELQTQFLFIGHQSGQTSGKVGAIAPASEPLNRAGRALE